jgi:hypothetical protein
MKGSNFACVSVAIAWQSVPTSQGDLRSGALPLRLSVMRELRSSMRGFTCTFSPPGEPGAKSAASPTKIGRLPMLWRAAVLLVLCLLNMLLPSAAELALAAPQQVMPIACRLHGARDCGMMAAMDGMAMDGPASGPQLLQSGCPSGQCLQAVLSSSVSIASRHTSGPVRGITLVRLLRTLGSLPVLTFSNSAPRAPPSSSVSLLFQI